MSKKQIIMLSIVFFALVKSTNIVIAVEKPLNTIVTLHSKIEYNKVFAENLSNIELNLKNEDKLQINKSTEKVSLDDKIKLTPEEEDLKAALEIQKGKDIEDIKILWDSTVERNPVIRFALEKIVSPPEERAVKSSIMAKTITTMIQGISIVPSLFGMGLASEYGSAIGGQIAARAFQKNFIPESGPPSITEPELIQLSGLIEDLQEEIITNYYNYKSCLESLILEKQNTLIQKRNHTKALKSNDFTSIIITSALLDKAKQAETDLKQQAKLHRLQLERLAGIETVSNLNLAINDEIIQASNNFNKSKNNPKEKIKDENQE